MLIRTHPVATIFLGVLVGAAAVLFLTREPNPAYANTAHGNSKKTMVTVPLDAGMEAVVTLDHLTCDLTGYVLDRFTGKFFIQYRYNVASDFKIRQGRPPEFIVGAGQADFRKFNGNERLADGVIYVSEANSGQVVAYGMPWNTQLRANSAPPQRRPFVPLDFARTRFVDLDALAP